MTRARRLPLIARAVVIAAAAIAVGLAFLSADDGSPSAEAAGDPIRLLFTISTDADDELLFPLIDDFNELQHEVGGRPIVVEGEGETSGKAETAIAEGRMRPVIWAPASSLWGRLLNHHAGGQWVADANPSIVHSPQVIAMWKPVARALGWPDEPIGWNDLLALATDPEGWASRGKPQYGRFKLGHSNPNSSTSGLSAVASMYNAVAGGLTAEDIERPGVRRAVREIERSIVRYDETADDFLAQMARYGPDYAHAVAVQERSLVKFNEENEDAELVAVYPAEGTFVADYPFIVLDAPWVDTAEREAAEVFRRWLLPRITPELAAAAWYRKPDSHVIRAPVDAAHGADPDQPQTETTISRIAPDVIAAIQANWNEDRKPANVMLVVDSSASLGRQGSLEPQQAALEGFLDRLRPEDRVGLVTFGSEVFQPVPLAPFDEGEQELRQAIRDLIPSGKSALYDAVETGFGKILDLEDETRINAVVVVADGADDSSRASLQELTGKLSRACRAGGVVVPIFTVAYGGEADGEALARIAGACQGDAATAGPVDISEVVRDIALLF